MPKQVKNTADKMSSKNKRKVPSLPSADTTLSEVVELTRQFQRAVRLDADFGNVDALKGYICQGTARNVLESTARQITSTLNRSFTWTGPYGGGKSSLALALCSIVSPNQKIRNAAFDVLGIDRKAGGEISKAFSTSKAGWLVLPVVGYRGSVIDGIFESLAKYTGIPFQDKGKQTTRQRTTQVLQLLTDQALQRIEDGVLLVIDELGKFLEASASDGDDIYFYQELADLASRSTGKIIVVGILHQSFEQYANRLSSELRDEWRKIQGRYTDIALVAASDEVVELTGRAISSSHAHPESLPISERVAASIRHRRPGLGVNFAQSLDRCWPLHPVTAALLGPVSKRRFGQNERSTFGFLASVEARSLKEFLQTTPISAKLMYTPSAYWEYLRTNLEPSILASPDRHRWAQSVEAVERTEQRQKDGNLHVQLVKTIALIDLFRNGSGLVANDVLLSTCILDQDGHPIDEKLIASALQDLQRWAVVMFKRHIGSWSITEGSDFDLDASLSKELGTIDEPNISDLSALVKLQPILAKRHYCETGTLRWMVPLMTHSIQINGGVANANEVCGGNSRILGQSSAFGAFLIVLPARNQTTRQTLNIIRKLDLRFDIEKPILIGVPKNGEAIRELGRELLAYERIRLTSSELENDAVARRELAARTSDVRSRLEDELRDALLNVQWANNQEVATDSRSSPVRHTRSLPQLASILADNVFHKSPKIFSELVNRDLPSSNSAKARKDLLYAMLRAGDKPRLGLVAYPAEAGLYANLLAATGIHRQSEDIVDAGAGTRFGFFAPTEAHGLRGTSFVALWIAATNLVIKDAQMISLVDLYALWQAPPFGVRAGVLPILWLAFVLANQHCMAVYKDGMFIPELRDVDVDEALQNPSRFAIRHVQIDENRKQILQGIATQMTDLGQHADLDPLQAARSMVGLVYALPQWTLATNQLSKKARAVRDTLTKASDPHKVLFVDLPVLFGDVAIEEYLSGLKEAFSELLEIYPKMLRSVLQRTLDTLGASMTAEADINTLQARARTVLGISGNLQLDAFAGRLARMSHDLAAIEGLLGLALNKPPRDWNDRDIDATLIQLAQWALLFRQIEAVSAVQDRAPTRNAIAVVFGAGKQGRTVSESFDVSDSEEAHIEKLATKITSQLKGSTREICLAALARAGASFVEAAQATPTTETEDNL